MGVKLNRDFGVLKYNASAEEGEVELKESFLDEHQVIQIDILTDWIADLNEFLEVIRGDQA